MRVTIVEEAPLGYLGLCEWMIKCTNVNIVNFIKTYSKLASADNKVPYLSSSFHI